MKMLLYKLSRHSLELIYFPYVRPTLQYGDVVWGACTGLDAKLLEGVQLAEILISLKKILISGVLAFSMA